MPKEKLTDYNTSEASNTDIGGINIGEGCQYGNMNNAARMSMKHVADALAGTNPIFDTLTFGDPADLAKRFRFDAGSVTTGNTRVYTAPDFNGTLVLSTGTQTLSGKSFADNADVTKVLAFNLAGITTATTRTITWPDASGTVMLSAQYPTITSLEGLSLVAGDTLYATAADTLARRAIGTTAQIMTVAGGVPTWVDDSALVKIETKAASGASIAFTDLSGYAYVEMVFDSVVYSGVNTPFIRVSTDNGVSYAGPAGSYDGLAGNDATGVNSDTEILLVDGSTIGELDGRIYLSYFNNAAEKTAFDGVTRVGTSMNVISARRDVAEANNAILVSTSTGTMTSGSVTIWGRKR